MSTGWDTDFIRFLARVRLFLRIWRNQAIRCNSRSLGPLEQKVYDDVF